MARGGIALAILALCRACLRGGPTKPLDWPAALAGTRHFCLHPAPVFAAATSALELGASALVLSRWHLQLGTLSALGAFIGAATLIANRFWKVSGPERFALTNAFFEHLGLVGAFALVAPNDSARKGDRK